MQHQYIVKQTGDENEENDQQHNSLAPDPQNLHTGKLIIVALWKQILNYVGLGLKGLEW